jgi:hypothetical protein
MTPAAKGAKAKCSTAAFPKLFMFRERTRNMSALLRTVAPPPCLPLYIKNWLKEDRILIGCLHTACEAALPLLLVVVCLHLSSFLHRELYIQVLKKLS